MRLVADNVTKVRSVEDIMDARCERIEIVVDPHSNDPTVIQCSAQAARALARMLNRHANFINPRGRRR